MVATKHISLPENILKCVCNRVFARSPFGKHTALRFSKTDPSVLTSLTCTNVTPHFLSTYFISIRYCSLYINLHTTAIGYQLFSPLTSPRTNLSISMTLGTSVTFIYLLHALHTFCCIVENKPSLSPQTCLDLAAISWRRGEGVVKKRKEGKGLATR